MSELNIVNKTKQPNTIDSIYNELINIGVEEGDVLLVHSSLSNIGWVCGGEVAVIQALKKSVGESGTIVMPAHSGDNSDPANWGHPSVPEGWYETIYASMPAFNKQITPTRGMGRIAESFRTYPGSIRSDHPQVSFSANGKKSREIISSHPLTPQFGLDTPLGKLYEMKAKVLLLGADYSSCTSFHLSEYISKKAPLTKMGAAITREGVREWVWFEDLDYDADDFEQIGMDYEKEISEVRFGEIGNAESRLIPLKSAVDFATKWLIKNR